VVFGQDHVALLGAFQGEKWVAPNHFLTPLKFGKGIKGHFVGYFIIFRTLDHLKIGATTLVQLQINSMPITHHFCSFPGIFHHNHGSYHNFSNRERPYDE
jgi:hypothetical protein